jgi:hypothetical protein
VAVVPLVWEWIDVEPKEKWADIKKKLSFNVNQLNRAVYVIRLNGKFLVRYPWAKSPVVYIGEGDLPERLKSHNAVKSWMGKLASLIDGASFKVGVVCPRVQRAEDTYRDLEAHLLDTFAEKHGCVPLRNRQFESRLYNHEYSLKDIKHALNPWQGKRFEWAVEPQPCMGPIYDAFHLGWLPEAR